jgi:guanine nucleotide-binding protein subunit alpha, other
MALGSIMCFGSKESADPEAAKNKEIEKQIDNDRKKLAKEVKLLLLGRHIHAIA